MTRIFEALKKAQAHTAALPFPPAAPPPRPVVVPHPGTPAESVPMPRIETVTAGILPEDVGREMSALRVGLESALDGRRTRVVMFLSSVSGEGATTVATQFATVLARDGRHRTLLLDVGSPGAGSAARPVGARDTRPGPAGTAHALSVAAWSPDGRRGAARGPAALRSFLAAVSGQFEWVIIDGPAVLESPESIDLAPLVDGVVMVVRSGHTKRPVVQRAADLLRKSGVRILGSVLNRRRLEIPDFIYRRI